MSYMKRFIEDECERLGNEYGYPEDLIMDAINYAEYDWERVEYMCRARVLRWWVEQMEEKERAYEEANERVEEENTQTLFGGEVGFPNS